MANSKDSGSLHFEVDARLLFQLGEQLVARRSIALAELVKNAYDADATSLVVELNRVTQPGGQIIVRDNGSGMTFEEVAGAWMRVAGTNKREKGISSRFCRALSGAKGVGRFATRRLAKELVMESVAMRPDNSKERVKVHFDWDKFDTNEELQTIPVRYTRVSVSDTESTGVTLNLNGIREDDTWTQDDMEELQNDILSLSSPFDSSELLPQQAEEAGFVPLSDRITTQSGCEQDAGFNIEFRAAEFPSYEGIINHKIFEVAWGKLWGWVNEDGSVRYVLQSRATEQPQELSPSIKDVKCDFVAGAHFLIYFVVYKQDYLNTVLKVREASRQGRKYGGVRIYLDHFRVFPYGDFGDDWLDLDEIRASRNTATPPLVESLSENMDVKVKRPLLSIPGNNQLFGAVYISQRVHKKLELTVNRERLLENKAFYQLKKFVQNGIYWLTVEYARYNTEQRKQRLSEREKDVVASLNDLEMRVQAAPGIPHMARSEILDVIFATKRVAQEREEELIGEIALLRILASAGTTVIMFSHQLRALVDGLLEIRADLQRLQKDIPDSISQDYEEALELLEEWRLTIHDQAHQIGLLISPDSRKMRRRLAVRELFTKVCDALSGYLREYGITIENEVPANFRTPPMFEAELYSILLNIITNAAKAVRGRRSSTRIIRAEAEQISEGLLFRLMDTGVGLDLEKREEVFRPLVTYTPTDPVLGVGTGLGLKIVRDMVETYNGSVGFVDAKAPWNTVIEIMLPTDATKKREKT